jgi:predicted metalloprotease with PDZ domain
VDEKNKISEILVDRLVLKTMAEQSPEAQIPAAKPHSNALSRLRLATRLRRAERQRVHPFEADSWAALRDIVLMREISVKLAT